MRWKVASDLRFRVAISEPETLSFCGISGDLGPSTQKSLAIAIMRFWCSKLSVAGTLPSLQPDASLFKCSGNQFEGTLPHQVMTPSLAMLDISAQAGRRGDLQGPLPSQFGRNSNLAHLLVAHQSLQGSCPQYRSTLRILCLQDNFLKAMSDQYLARNGAARVLVHNNRLSCHPPVCGDAEANTSLAAVGNSFLRPTQSFPAWISPMERNDLLWASSKGGRHLFLKLSGACSLLACVVGTRFRYFRFVQLMFRWRFGPGPHLQFSQACAKLISCMVQVG